MIMKIFQYGMKEPGEILSEAIDDEVMEMIDDAESEIDDAKVVIDSDDFTRSDMASPEAIVYGNGPAVHAMMTDICKRHTAMITEAKSYLDRIHAYMQDPFDRMDQIKIAQRIGEMANALPIMLEVLEIQDGFLNHFMYERTVCQIFMPYYKFLRMNRADLFTNGDAEFHFDTYEMPDTILRIISAFPTLIEANMIQDHILVTDDAFEVGKTYMSNYNILSGLSLTELVDRLLNPDTYQNIYRTKDSSISLDQIFNIVNDRDMVRRPMYRDESETGKLLHMIRTTLRRVSCGSYDTIMDIVNGLNDQAANRELTCKLTMLINLTAMSIILAVQQMTQLVEYFSRNERLIRDIHDLYQKYINIGNV